MRPSRRTSAVGRFAAASLLALTLGLTACASSGQQGREQGVGPAAPEESARTEAETALLNAFFATAFEEELALSPQRQTTLGRKTNLDRWDDVSPEATQTALDLRMRQLAEMRRQFDPARLTRDGRLSFQLFELETQGRLEAARFRDHGYTFNQMFGAQSRLPAFLINQHRVGSLPDAEAYVRRLETLGDQMDQHIANARRAAGMGIRPPRFVYDAVLRDAGNIIAGAPFGAKSDASGSADEQSPLLADLVQKLGGLQVDPAVRADLLRRGTAALADRVGPAYRRLIVFLANERGLAPETAGVLHLPDGRAYYKERLKTFTTTDMTAEQIHQLGLSEVARIHREMNAIRDTLAFEGTLKDFFLYMRTDPQFYYPNTDEGRERYLAEATRLIDVMRARLPEQFGRLPKADMVVRRVEAFREQSAGKAFYQRPSLDGSRPGIYYANLSNMADMPIYQMEALAYHEGVPGHHMQIAIAQELTGVPEFRRMGSFTAYSEGWGLYTELLPKEMGFYADPYSDFGRLAMELWRAARLVVDTGLHDKGWSREQAIDYLLQNTPNSEGDCVRAIERYIVMPGQATAYTVGMLEILRLREMARTSLGARYDQRAFHDLVLGAGPVPLEVLAREVERWIADRKL